MTTHDSANVDCANEASPCIKVCVMQRRHDICIGCGRTLTEIARWSELSPQDRISVNASLEARLKTLTARPRASS